MGDYNPHLPQILGQEWVGIKDVDLTFSPALNAVEIGHKFSLETNRQVSQGRFYLKEQPDGQSQGQVYMMNVYPAGTESMSGPIRSVLIPVNAAAITGTFAAGTAADIPTRLLSPAGNTAAVQVIPSDATSQKSLALFFDMNRYQQLLNGKRIVGVNLLHMLTWNPVNPNDGSVAEKVAPLVAGTSLTLRTGAGVVRQFQYSPEPYFFISGSDVVGFSSLLAMPDVATGLPGSGVVSKVALGDVNYLWSTPANTTTADVMPWRYEELKRFESSAGSNRYWFQYNFGGSSQWAGEYYLAYAAIEVLFCEEQRVIFGGRDCSQTSINGNLEAAYDIQTIICNLRSASALASNPILAPGDYTVTVASANIGDINGVAQYPVSEPGVNNPYPILNALRELYPVAPQTGIQVNLEDTQDQVFTDEYSLVLPQLSLHASGGDPLTEVHAYGIQARAQVYGTITATQDVIGGTGMVYNWARFYARRFGLTTVPLLLSSNIGGASTVDISPAEFDALDEIVDGWKEVTLQFPAAVTMTAQPTWTWSATGELPGNRWEVLGVTAPAISGIPGNILNLVPAAQRLTLATYGNDATVQASWMPGFAPPVSGTTADPSTDMAIMFAMNPLTITGFGAANAEQEMTGIGLDCGLDPCCIPTALNYVRLTWGLPLNTNARTDDFSPDVAAGSWGPAYTLVGTASDYLVVSEQGLITFSANNSSRFATMALNAINFDIQADYQAQSTVATGTIRGGLVGRFTNNLNNYSATLDISSTGAVTLRVEKRVAGVATTLATPVLTNLTGGLNATNTIRFVGFGTYLKAKAWQTGYPEPEGWDVEINDSDLLTGGEVGIFARDESAVTGHIAAFSNLRITPPRPWFGYYELQRMDTVETDWKTIMKATDSGVTGFNDYEARVGILSSYRIRSVDVYDFPGAWSSTVTATVPSPGVTIGCTGGHLLIFTSNERQDGSINLAYSSVWEGRVEESFTFAESQFVELQAMYNRDYFTAFRPTERGGEQFQRTVLVQAAAIDPETLGDFTSLRDMAWEDVSYICVRDEDGNRWLATVLVPSGRVTFNRRLYMAPINIIEVTDTPSEVDP